MPYLDNAATSFPKAPGVPEAVAAFLKDTAGSPGRSAHRHSRNSSRVLFECRESLARLLGLSDSRRVLFTSGATEALNLALRGILRAGDRVLVSGLEHNAVMRPLRWLSPRLGLHIDVVPPDDEGRLKPSDFHRALRHDTALVVVNHASNVCGTVAPIADIRACIGQVPLLVDASQSAGSVDINVERDGVDLLAFTGHKSLLGPQGTGGLAVVAGLEDAIEPLRLGGTGSRSDTQEQPEMLPDRYEGGTPNTPGIAGLLEALRYLERRGLNDILAHEEGLAQKLHEGLRDIDGVRVIGPRSSENTVPTRSFITSTHTPDEIGFRLERQYDVAVRVGLHCAPLAHQSLGSFPTGGVRMSLNALSTDEDLETALDALRAVTEKSAR